MRSGQIKTPIPQLDLRRFDAGEAQRAAFLAELRTAAHEVGFFYVTGHDVETHLLLIFRTEAEAPVLDSDSDKLETDGEFAALPRLQISRFRAHLPRPAGLARTIRHRRGSALAITRGGSSPVWERLQRAESMARSAAGAASRGHALCKAAVMQLAGANSALLRARVWTVRRCARISVCR